MNRDNMNELDCQIVSILKTNFNGAPLSKDLIKSVNWQEMFNTKSYGNLWPLIYYTLEQNDSFKWISEEYFRILTNAFLVSTSRNMLITEEFSKVLEVLNAKKVDVLGFKGAVFAEKIYPNIGLRPMSDIDLLVRDKNSLEEVKKILFDLGYEVFSQERNDTFAEAVIYEITFVNLESSLDPPLHVDVHHNLPYIGYKKENNSLSNTELVWKSSTVNNIENKNIWVMSPEDTIANLIGHELVQHKDERILFYCDIGFHVKLFDIDWSKITQSLYGSVASVYALQVYYRAKFDFGIPIPSYAISELEKISKTSGTFRSLLINNSEMIHVNLFDQIFHTEGMNNKIKIIIRYLFPSLNYMKEAYKTSNKIKLLLLYFYRPFFILIKSSFLFFKYIFVKFRHLF